MFESGGEIFYRRSNVGGTSWEAPARLSTGNGNNKYPSLTGTSSTQFVVWQRYTGYSGGQYKYDIYLAKNTGSGWSTAKITNLSNLGFSTQTDPLPVVTYKTRSGGYRLLVCARTSSGIKYVTSDNDGSTWSSASDLPSTTASHRNASLSMGPTTPASTVYVTYDNGSKIYLNAYATSWGTRDTTACNGIATINNKSSSVEVDGDSGIDVAWEGFDSKLNKWVIVHRRKSGISWGVVKYFQPGSGNEFHRPSITGHAGVKRSILWHDNGGVVYRAHTADGSSWTTVAWTDTWLRDPSLSAGSTSAKYAFTGGGGFAL